MAGEIAQAISLMQEQYNGGVDPTQLLIEMAEFVHLATKFKLSPEVIDSDTLSPEENRRGKAASERLSISALTRAWQILMKGLEELRSSPRPLQSADMVLVRLAYAAKMPTPGDALKLLDLRGAFSGSEEAQKENLDRKISTLTTVSGAVSVKAERGANSVSNSSTRSFAAALPTTGQVSKKLLPIDSKPVDGEYKSRLGAGVDLAYVLLNSERISTFSVGIGAAEKLTDQNGAVAADTKPQIQFSYSLSFGL